MSDFWQQVKKTVEDSAEFIKKEVDVVSKAIAKNAPIVGAAVADTTKKTASFLAVKTGEVAEISKLKVKLFGLRQQASKKFTELGGRVFELSHAQRDISVFIDDKVKSVLEAIKEIKHEAELAEKELQKQYEAFQKSGAAAPKTSCAKSAETKQTKTQSKKHTGK